MRPLSEEEVNTYLEVFDLHEKLIVRLAIIEGMRPGEIFALRWKSVRDEMIRVEQRVYKRVFDTPKNGKSREAAHLGWDVVVAASIGRSGAGCQFRWVCIPVGKLSTPLSADNIWRRNMKPKLQKIGMEWATFQILRRQTEVCRRRRALIRRLPPTSADTGSASA